MKGLTAAVTAFLFFGWVAVGAQTTKRTDTAKVRTIHLALDSLSKDSADRNATQNRKRAHTKNIYEDKKVKTKK